MCQCTAGACWLRVDEYDYQKAAALLTAGNRHGFIVLERARLGRKRLRMESESLETITGDYCRDKTPVTNEKERDCATAIILRR